MALHNEIGISGEDIAVDYLKKNSYCILHRNWRSNRCEIDIIASNSDFVVFLEVKTRKNEKWGYPEDSVTPSKIKRIIQVADAYINKYEIDKPIRFDIISINITEHSINHIVDAFWASLD